MKRNPLCFAVALVPATALALGLAGCVGARATVNAEEEEEEELPGGCVDLDGDGYGIGSECEGPDCNDLVADIHAESECDDYCAAYYGTGLGCPCDAAEGVEVCYAGPPGTAGNGTCRPGLVTCEDGVWGKCEGQVLPIEERCDEIDNDCDGEIDEGVLDGDGTCGEDDPEECADPPCGTCEPCGSDADCENGYCGVDGRCTVTVEMSYHWREHCTRDGSVRVTVPDVPAGLYRLTALESAATAWSRPFRAEGEGWFYKIDCTDIRLPELISGNYSTPEEVWDDLDVRTQEIEWPGGDLSCGVRDWPCDDNEGEIHFRMDLVCPEPEEEPLF